MRGNAKATKLYQRLLTLLPGLGYCEVGGLLIQRSPYGGFHQTSITTEVYLNPDHPDYPRWRGLPVLLMHNDGILVYRPGTWLKQLHRITTKETLQLPLFPDI